jgi:hypothetical protein
MGMAIDDEQARVGAIGVRVGAAHAPADDPCAGEGGRVTDPPEE